MNLIEAADCGNLKHVRKCIKRNVNVNRKNVFGSTALHYSTAHGHEEIVSLLLQSTNIDVNLKGHVGRSALDYAVANERFRIVELLVTQNADCNSVSDDELTPLKRALLDYAKCKKKETEACEKLKLLDDCKSFCQILETLPSFCKPCADLAKAVMMVKKGNGDLFAQNYCGTLKYNNLESCEEEIKLLKFYQLMKFEAIPFDVGLESIYQSLFDLRRRKPGDIVRILCETSIKADFDAVLRSIKENKEPTIHNAALLGDKESVLRFIDSIDEKSIFQRTALHFAVRNKQYEIIELLVKNGAQCCNFNDTWETPMHYAFQEYLLCCGVKKNGSFTKCEANSQLENCSLLKHVYDSIPENVPKCAQLAVAIFMVSHGNAIISLTNKQTNYFKIMQFLGDTFNQIIFFLIKVEENRITNIAKCLDNSANTNDASGGISQLNDSSMLNSRDARDDEITSERTAKFSNSPDEELESNDALCNKYDLFPFEYRYLLPKEDEYRLQQKQVETKNNILRNHCCVNSNNSSTDREIIINLKEEVKCLEKIIKSLKEENDALKVKLDEATLPEATENSVDDAGVCCQLCKRKQVTITFLCEHKVCNACHESYFHCELCRRSQY